MYRGEASDIAAWSISSGQWEMTEGRFVQRATGPNRIATVHTYQVFGGDAAAAMSGGAHRWFNVQLVHRRSYTTVKVNGVTLFDKVYQPDAQSGSLAVLTHSSLANFDNISIKQAPR